MSYSQLLGVYGGVILLAIFLLILAEKFSAWSEAEVSIESDDLDPVEAEPKLNAWDRFCLRCDRAYGRMRQLVPVFLMTLAAIMAVPAAVGCCVQCTRSVLVA